MSVLRSHWTKITPCTMCLCVTANLQVVELTFYSIGNKRRKTYDGDADVIVEPMLCALCAGMSMDPDGAFIDDKLAAVFTTPRCICQTCLNNNEKYYARGYQMASNCFVH